jgi:hypothetical protein
VYDNAWIGNHDYLVSNASANWHLLEVEHWASLLKIEDVMRDEQEEHDVVIFMRQLPNRNLLLPTNKHNDYHSSMILFPYGNVVQLYKPLKITFLHS